MGETVAEEEEAAADTGRKQRQRWWLCFALACCYCSSNFLVMDGAKEAKEDKGRSREDGDRGRR